jgi:hypothetical protein
MSFLNSHVGSKQSLANIFLVGAVVNNVAAINIKKCANKKEKGEPRLSLEFQSLALCGRGLRHQTQFEAKSSGREFDDSVEGAKESPRKRAW